MSFFIFGHFFPPFFFSRRVLFLGGSEGRVLDHRCCLLRRGGRQSSGVAVSGQETPQQGRLLVTTEPIEEKFKTFGRFLFLNDFCVLCVSMFCACV